jgi:hypothetical protein
MSVLSSTCPKFENLVIPCLFLPLQPSLDDMEGDGLLKFLPVFLARSRHIFGPSEGRARVYIEFQNFPSCLSSPLHSSFILFLFKKKFYGKE